ncbi:MAG TPA: tRNA lysidine(34) synthetase TilS [Puia sp.]|nr:tRNA lysidine(34) synthetase TilS [Puia sp.]
MDLLQSFHDFIRKEKLFAEDDRLLIAVSGGVDSVVLAELCHLGGFPFAIAHCNFGLRGDESRRDEEFVRQLADRYDCKVWVKAFDTLAYAGDHRLSVQAAARELRYAWFGELIRAGHARFVATAHHADDNVETLLMNFFKGTGIAGLRAMLPRQGILLRPLLFACRADIEGFARQRQLAWVEDSSNSEDKYTRNFFRHQLIPLVEKAYPTALTNVAGNIPRFREIELIYRKAVEQQKRRLLEFRGEEVYIPILKLKQAEPLDTLLYEIGSPYGFSPQQTEAFARLLDSPSGKYIVSATHRILKDRRWLIISPLVTKAAAIVPVEEGDGEVAFEHGLLRLEKMSTGGPEQWDQTRLDQGPKVALLSAADIRYPLLLRRWKPGDYFYPLGMRKKKKLSRFFIDNKLSVADKEKVWVLEAGKRILWIVGHRIDDRFKVARGVKEVLRIEWVQPRNGDDSAR